MKIKAINLVNFKGFKNASLTFDEQLTVIIGANGSGKSSILDAISITLSWIIARIRNAKGQGLYIAEEQIHNGSKNGNIEASFDNINSIAIPSKTKRGYNKAGEIILNDLNSYCENTRANIEANEQQTSIPIFVKYGVGRAVVDIPLRIRKPHIFELFETYENSLRGDANFRSFFEWYRNQEDIENERVKEQINLFNYKDHMLFRPDRELDAVRNAIYKFMPEFNKIRVRRNPLQMVVEKKGEQLAVNQLSDGEKTYIALVGDLCRRLVLANPTLENPLEGEGIVLIDELDLHLHPQWQTEITTRLCETFPNVQFIVTTHSPLVITNVQTHQLRIMSNANDNANVSVSQYGYALPVSVILKDIMKIDNELPKHIEDLMSQIYDSLNQGTKEKTLTLLNELELLSPHLPELGKLRKFVDIKFRDKE